MFSKVLVANRGEIAVRVIRACRELGVASVAVYSDLDANSMHVRLADEAYALGGETAAESYLNTEAIYDDHRKIGSGRGSPGLRILLGERRLRPGNNRDGRDIHRTTTSAIEVMGDKISAREAAETSRCSRCSRARPT